MTDLLASAYAERLFIATSLAAGVLAGALLTVALVVVAVGWKDARQLLRQNRKEVR